jgi:hypothetical protein
LVKIMVRSVCELQAEQLDNMSSKELLSTLSFGADRIFAKEAGEKPTDEELDAIIDRSNEKAAAAAGGAAQGGAMVVKEEDTVAIKEEAAAGCAGGSSGAGPSSAAPVLSALR